MHGITGYGAYIPRYRLDRAEAAAAHGFKASGKRAVACHDEDTTTLAVGAARTVLRGAGDSCPLWLGTANPAYADKSNAATVRAALDMDEGDTAIDVAGSLRSGIGAFLSASQSDGLAVLSDVQTGLPASEDELGGGDAAAAFRFGRGGGVIAEMLGHASVSREFLDRWRMPGAVKVHRWEERFGAGQYVDLLQQALRRILDQTDMGEPDYLIVSCPNAKSIKIFLKSASAKMAVVNGLEGVGYAGAADAGLMLADVLDRAGPGQTIVVLNAADGCDALALRATEALAEARSAFPVAEQLAETKELRYVTYLTWRGLLERQPPRRPDPEAPSPSVMGRGQRWKYALVGSRCGACGQVHLPPQRVCAQCGAIDGMETHAVANRLARVTTYTVDRLAFSLSPPVVAAVLDFDGGGRLVMEMADIDPEDMAVGIPVEMSFRRHYTSSGIHNYSWKARVARSH